MNKTELTKHVDSLFSTMDLYDPDSIDLIISKINHCLISDGNSEKDEVLTMRSIVFQLISWKDRINIINNEIPHYSTSVIVPYKITLFTPIYTILELLCEKQYVDIDQIKEGKDYISNIYRTIIYQDLNIFAFLIQPAMYHIAVTMENPDTFICDKIENTISTYSKYKEIILDLSKIRDNLNKGKIKDYSEFKAISSNFLKRLKKTHGFVGKMYNRYILLGVFIALATFISIVVYLCLR